MMLLGALVGICGLWASVDAGRQGRSVEGRVGVDLLDPWERMEPSTRGRRSRYFESFERWASLRVEETLWEIGARRIDRLLAEYGQQLFDARGSMSAFRETVYAVGDRHLELRDHMPSSWEAVYSWSLREPACSNLPMPPMAFFAGVTVALEGGYYGWAALLRIGYLCLARPGELYCLKRSAVVLPWDVLRTRGVGFARFDRPKTRKKGPRKQHAIIAEWAVLCFLRALFRHLSPDGLILAGGPECFRMIWAWVFGGMGFPVTQGTGLTPAALRAGGASLHYMLFGDLPRLQWLGRWLSYRSMCIYVQEIAAENVFLALNGVQQERVQWLAQRAPGALWKAAQQLWEMKVFLRPLERFPWRKTRAKKAVPQPQEEFTEEEDDNEDDEDDADDDEVPRPGRPRKSRSRERR